MAQQDIDRVQEFHKCIECFLCQNVCHVIRDHEENKPSFAGPRMFIRYAELEMHPLETGDRRELLSGQMGLGLCNITKCCTEVCPEHINITDNAIIPLKERVADVRYDPITWLGDKIRRRARGYGLAGHRPAEAGQQADEGGLGEADRERHRGHAGGAAGHGDQAAVVDQEGEHARGHADQHLADEEQPELADLGAEGDLVAEPDEAAEGRPGGAGGRRRPQRPVVGDHPGHGHARRRPRPAAGPGWSGR